MTGAITAAVSTAGRAELQRAADCCTALLAHRRALASTARRRLRLS